MPGLKKCRFSTLLEATLKFVCNSWTYMYFLPYCPSCRKAHRAVSQWCPMPAVIELHEFPFPSSAPSWAPPFVNLPSGCAVAAHCKFSYVGVVLKLSKQISNPSPSSSGDNGANVLLLIFVCAQKPLPTFCTGLRLCRHYCLTDQVF